MAAIRNWAARQAQKTLLQMSEIINKSTEEARKMPENTPQIPEAKSGPLVHSGLGNQFRDKLPPGYIEWSMSIDDISCSWILNCRQPACSQDLGSVEKYEHVTTFQRDFLIQNSNRSDLFLCNQSVIFLRDIVCVRGTAAIVNEKHLLTDLADGCDKALQLNDGHLARSSFSQRLITCENKVTIF